MADPERFRTEGFGALATLPDYLISCILMRPEVGLDTLAVLSCCSKALRVFACEEMLYQQHCLRMDAADMQPLKYMGNWRQTALQLLADTVAHDTQTQQGSVSGRNVSPRRCPLAGSIAAAARPLPPVPLQSDFLYRRYLRCHMQLAGFAPPPPPAGVAWPAAVAVTSVRSHTPESFRREYDWPCVPCVMTDTTNDWQKDHDWTLAGLAAQYGSVTFNVSKPGAASGRCGMRMSDYYDYTTRQHDEEPLYVFDPEFVESEPLLRDAYTIPHVFDQDYLSVMGLKDRPHFRWLVVGPARSGASWHVDPALTSAWNTLCSGKKRWALYPPTHIPPGVTLVESEPHTLSPDGAYTSLQWYLEVYPALPPDQRPIEFIQEPGTTVFVPGGWWHMVLNLEDSVAVTQNYVSDANLDRVVCYMTRGSLHYHTHLNTYYPAHTLDTWHSWYTTTHHHTQHNNTNPNPHTDQSNDSDSGDSDSWVTEDGIGSETAGDSETDSLSESESDTLETSQSLVTLYRSLGLPVRDGTVSTEGPTMAAGTSGVCGSVMHHGQNGADKDPPGLLGTGPVQYMRVRLDLTNEPVSGSSQVGSGGVEGDGGKEKVDGGVVECVGKAAGWPARRGLPLQLYQRERLLGGWLRQLVAAQPALHDRVAVAVTRHAAGAVWQRLIATVAAADPTHTPTLTPHTLAQHPTHHAPHASSAHSTAHANGKSQSDQLPEAVINGCGGQLEGQLEQLLPDVGADSLVFHVCEGRVIKLITTPDLPMAGLMAASEALVPNLLQLPPWPHSHTHSHTQDPAKSPPNPPSALPFWPRRHYQGVLEVQIPRTQSNKPHDTDPVRANGSRDQPKAHERGTGSVDVNGELSHSNGRAGPHGGLGGEGAASGAGSGGRWQVLPFTVQQDVTASAPVVHWHGETGVGNGGGWRQLRSVLDSKTRDVRWGDDTAAVGKSVCVPAVDVAAQLGRMLAALHVRGHVAAVRALSAATPTQAALPSIAPALAPASGPASSMGSSNPDWHSVQTTDTWWHDRYGNVWTGRQGQCVTHGRVCDQAPEPAVGVSALRDGPGGVGTAVTCAWGPFKSFIQSRRDALLSEMMDEAAPDTGYFIQQVEHFVSDMVDKRLLPSDMPPVLPTLVHGDISNNNLFVTYTSHPATADEVVGSTEESNTPRLQWMLVDYGDAGMGDPLYDFVMLHVTVFKLKTPQLAACWDAYKRALADELQSARTAGEDSLSAQLAGLKLGPSDETDPLGLLWPKHAAKWSEVAMLYSLLHEEGHEAVWVGRSRAQLLGSTCITWPEAPQVSLLTQHIWGVLDK